VLCAAWSAAVASSPVDEIEGETAIWFGTFSVFGNSTTNNGGEATGKTAAAKAGDACDSFSSFLGAVEPDFAALGRIGDGEGPSNALSSESSKVAAVVSFFAEKSVAPACPGDGSSMANKDDAISTGTETGTIWASPFLLATLEHPESQKKIEAECGQSIERKASRENCR